MLSRATVTLTSHRPKHSGDHCVTGSAVSCKPAINPHGGTFCLHLSLPGKPVISVPNMCGLQSTAPPGFTSVYSKVYGTPAAASLQTACVVAGVSRGSDLGTRHFGKRNEHASCVDGRLPF